MVGHVYYGKSALISKLYTIVTRGTGRENGLVSS